MEENNTNVDKPKKDTQSRSWILVINNYDEHGISPQKFEEILSNIPSMRYWCYSLECGSENQTPHIQGFMVTKSPIRFSTLHNKFNKVAHLEQAKGSPQENRDYVLKQGKWADTEKASTNTGIFKEWGELPQSHQGQRNELITLYELVKEGLTDSEILEICGETAIKNVDKIGKLRLAYLRDKYKSQRRLDLKVHYITGKTGTGKTRGVLDEHGDENVYRVTDYTHPFDNYQCEPVILFDEFRGGIKLSDMLCYLDIYPIALPARYAPKIACFHEVYVISNYTFEQQYEELQKNPEQKSSYEAWVRRFNGYVKEYTDDGIITYSTMQDYLNRKHNFTKAPLNNPFTASSEQQTKKQVENVKQEELPFIP